LVRILAEKKQIIIANNLTNDIYIFADEDMITTVVRNLLTMQLNSQIRAA
jgi:signal transduction histidine kinase